MSVREKFLVQTYAHFRHGSKFCVLSLDAFTPSQNGYLC